MNHSGAEKVDQICSVRRTWYRVPIFVTVMAAVIVSVIYYANSKRNSADPPISLPQCAHWAIVRAAEKVGSPISASESYKLLPPAAEGHSLQQIADALTSLGLSAEIRKADLSELLHAPPPVIIHLRNPDHFIVAMGMDSPDRLVMTDPGGDLRVVTLEPLQQRATGYGILVRRDEKAMETRKDSEVSPKDVASPVLQFETLLVNQSGILPSEKEIRFEFPFTNAGNKPLTIAKIHTKCSCLRSESPTTSIAPGEQSKIVLVYKVDPGKPGFLEEAAVESDDPKHPVLMLKASGRLNFDVRVTPSLVNFGLCEAGKSHKKMIFVRFGKTALPVTARIEGEAHVTAEVLSDTTEFDARKIWEGAGERPENLKDWPLVCVELTLQSEANETFSFYGEPHVILSTPIKEFQNVEIPLFGRVASVE